MTNAKIITEGALKSAKILTVRTTVDAKMAIISIMTVIHAKIWMNVIQKIFLLRHVLRVRNIFLFFEFIFRSKSILKNAD